MKLLVLALIGLCLVIPALARRRVNDLERLVAKEQLTELHWFYNTNMDAAAALAGKLGPSGTSAELTRRVNNVLSVFCPDPEFQGWFARGGLMGEQPLTARRRDTPNTLDLNNFSVTTLYRDFLPTLIFINSSQHFVGMPIITVTYGEDGRLYAEFNATLRQLFNQGPAAVNPVGILSESLGHYNNYFVFLEGNHHEDGKWCMRQFNANTDFAPTHNVGTYTLGPQMANDAYLSGDKRPEVN